MQRIALLLVLTTGCDLGAATTLTPPPDTGPETEDTAGSEDDTGDTGETTPPDPWQVDDDGDGWTENDGDCDDEDASVHPDQADTCDGRDDDCDGARDEDAVGDDIHEPNDTEQEWAWLGSLAETRSVTVSARLHNDDDVDRFSFYVDDPWYSSFGFTVDVTGVPTGASWKVAVGQVDTAGAFTELEMIVGEGPFHFEVDGTAGQDDAGDYGVVVESIAGADCARAYALTVAEG